MARRITVWPCGGIPRTAEAGFDWARPELYQHIARVCERGKFDMVFFADLNYISDTYRGTMDPAIRHATQAPEHDPIPLLSFMAAATTRIGLGATFSISHSHPFYAARLWATLDHLTRGRAAWNVVTSLNHNQSANYGEERRRPTSATTAPTSSSRSATSSGIAGNRTRW